MLDHTGPVGGAHNLTQGAYEFVHQITNQVGGDLASLASRTANRLALLSRTDADDVEKALVDACSDPKMAEQIHAIADQIRTSNNLRLQTEMRRQFGTDML